MPNYLVSWPADNPGSQAAAQAYVAACDAHYADTFEEGGRFGYVRPDRYGRPTAPLYDEYWGQTSGYPDFAEPPECAALRADAVMVTIAQWPDED